MVKRNGDTFQLQPLDREQFVSALTNDPADRFARTFVRKADLLQLWPAWGAFTPGGQLAGAIAWSITRRLPRVANLQLLHTFATHRRRGVGRLLCEHFLTAVQREGIDYWRVSSEPGAVEFYRSLGIQFLGRQKSGCLLTVAAVGATFAGCHYTLDCPVARAAVYRKGKGGCVEVYEQKETPGVTGGGVPLAERG